MGWSNFDEIFYPQGNSKIICHFLPKIVFLPFWLTIMNSAKTQNRQPSGTFSRKHFPAMFFGKQTSIVICHYCSAALGFGTLYFCSAKTISFSLAKQYSSCNWIQDKLPLFLVIILFLEIKSDH